MRINKFTYLMKEGIRGIFLHGFMSFAAVCVTVACLLIVGLFSSLVYNLSIMVEDLNETNKVIAYVDDTLELAEAKSIGSNINRIGNVQEAKFVDRREAMERFVSDYEETESFEGLQEDTLEHRYEITLIDNRKLTETVESLRAIPGVSDVRAANELAEGFSTLQDVLQIVSVLVIGILLVVSLLIISNTVKLAMYDRRDEIAIMKMVGATNGFISLPFVVEGFTLGMLGAGIAFGLEWLLYDALVSKIATMGIARDFLKFVDFTDLLLPMIATFGFAGLFVGVVGSWTSIRKFLDV